jgi:hypothetical protein
MRQQSNPESPKTNKEIIDSFLENPNTLKDEKSINAFKKAIEQEKKNDPSIIQVALAKIISAEKVYSAKFQNINKDDIKIIEQNSRLCTALISSLSIEEIEKLEMPSIKAESPEEKTDIVEFLNAHYCISTSPLMQIRDKYYEKILKNLEKGSPLDTEDFYTYLLLESKLTELSLDMSCELIVSNHETLQELVISESFLTYTRKAFSTKRFFEPMKTLKIFNRIPEDDFIEYKGLLTDQESFIYQQSDFLINIDNQAYKTKINIAVYNFYLKLREKLFEHNRADAIKLLDEATSSHDKLAILSTSNTAKEISKEGLSGKQISKILKTAFQKYDIKFHGETTTRNQANSNAPTANPPTANPTTANPTTANPTTANVSTASNQQQTSKDDLIAGLFVLISKEDDEEKLEKLTVLNRAIFKKNFPQESHLLKLEEYAEKSGEAKLLEPRYPIICKAFNSAELLEYFKKRDPDKELSEFSLAFFNQALESDNRSEIVDLALQSKSFLTALDISLEPKQLDLLINGSELDRPSTIVGYDKKKEFLSKKLTFFSKEKKEELLKLLLSDDDKFRNIKANREVILSSLGLDFIQQFYPPEIDSAQTLSRKKEQRTQTQPEISKLSDDEKITLLKSIFEVKDFDQEKLQSFVKNLLEKNPKMIAKEFQLSDQTSKYDEKFLSKIFELADPKLLVEKFIIEDSFTSELQKKSDLLLSFLKSATENEKKQDFTKSILESEKSGIIRQLIEQEESRDLVLSNIKGEFFHTKFLTGVKEEEKSEFVLYFLKSSASKEDKQELLRYADARLVQKLYDNQDSRDLIHNNIQGDIFYSKLVYDKTNEEEQDKLVSDYLSSTTTDENKKSLVSSIAKYRPNLFVKKLSDENFTKFLSDNIFKKDLNFENLLNDNKVSLFMSLPENYSHLTKDKEFLQRSFNDPKNKTINRNQGTQTENSEETPAKIEDTIDPETLPETSEKKLNSLIEILSPTTIIATQETHYVAPVVGPLKEFKLGFLDEKTISDSQALQTQYKNLFHNQFDTLFNKIIESQGLTTEPDKCRLKTSLYAILAISSGKQQDENGEEIEKFLAYYDEILNNNYRAETRVGEGHGSWIGQNKNRFTKAQTILTYMNQTFTENPDAFKKENIENWLKSQLNTPEVALKIHRDGDKQIANILKETGSATKDEYIIRNFVKDFLINNLEMLKNLSSSELSTSHKEKADILLEHSFEEFKKSELNKLSGYIPNKKLLSNSLESNIDDLKTNLGEKVQDFLNAISSKDSRLLNKHLEKEEAMLLLKFICQINHDEFANKLKEDLGVNENPAGNSKLGREIDNFVQEMQQGAKPHHKFQQDLIRSANSLRGQLQPSLDTSPKWANSIESSGRTK